MKKFIVMLALFAFAGVAHAEDMGDQVVANEADSAPTASIEVTDTGVSNEEIGSSADAPTATIIITPTVVVSGGEGVDMSGGSVVDVVIPKPAQNENSTPVVITTGGNGIDVGVSSEEETTTVSDAEAVTPTNGNGGGNGGGTKKKGGIVLGVQAPTFKFVYNLGRGMSNGDVVELQARLRAMGYFTYPTNTGYFGPFTQAAVEAYQKDHGIFSTGFVGVLTRASLNK